MRGPAVAAAVAAGGCAAYPSQPFRVPVGAAAGPTVTIPGVGSVEGVAAYGGHSYLGIPYAAPPVGDLRWQPPQPHAAWTGTRAATKFGAACIGAGASCNATSEDCLFLNVFTPGAAPAKPRPVMVWVHGGGYQSGCSNVFAGPALVNGSGDSVVVVTVNYRLNVFGFLGSSALATPQGGTGNYGIQDQRATLQWVHDNIAAFGGDAGNVLIFGESAGGNSMVQHLTQPASFPLYHKVVIESGTYHGCRSLASAESAFGSFAKKLGCTTRSTVAACARSKDTASVAKAGGGGGPVVDGVNLLKNNWEIMDAGEHNTKVPVMLGSNRDERAFWFVLEGKKNQTELQFDAAVASTGKVAQVKKLYDAANYAYPADLGGYNHWWWASMRASTDSATGLGACSVRHAARSLAAANPNVWSYMLAHPLQQPIPGVPGTGPGSAVVPHASEIMFVFNCGVADQPQCNTTAEFALGKEVSGYWTRFAAAGDPNGAGAVQWPRFTAAGDEVMRFDTAPAGNAVQAHLRKDACDFWDSQ